MSREPVRFWIDGPNLIHSARSSVWMEERKRNAILLLAVVQTWPEGDEPTDASLMERVLQCDSRALETLYDRYARPIYSLVLRISQQPASAEEIVQDVFLQLWRNAKRYQAQRGPLEPWLFTVARNRALDFLRLKREKQRRREDSADFDLPPSSVVRPDPEGAMDQSRRAEKVRALMNSLPETQRRAIELAFFEGMTHSEISAAIGEPLGTVKSWIRGGLLRLRESLEEARS
jgi:RNA polymerase sigma-70 factor (ECF subfamily)